VSCVLKSCKSINVTLRLFTWNRGCGVYAFLCWILHVISGQWLICEIIGLNKNKIYYRIVCTWYTVGNWTRIIPEYSVPLTDNVTEIDLKVYTSPIPFLNFLARLLIPPCVDAYKFNSQMWENRLFWLPVWNELISILLWFRQQWGEPQDFVNTGWTRITLCEFANVRKLTKVKLWCK